MQETQQGTYLDFEEHELVPGRWNYLTGNDVGLGEEAVFSNGARRVDQRVQLKCATMLGLPWYAIRKRHVQNVRNATRANDIVVIEQVAAFAIRVDRHVLRFTAERSTTSDLAYKRAKFLRVERIAQSEK